MSQGMTIADLVQQVYYAVYKQRLDVSVAADQSFHADTDKFKEVVMEANFVLQELQQAMDWNWLRARWDIGTAAACDDNTCIPEFTLPEDAYKVCTGFGDAVRLHSARNYNSFLEIPFTSARTGSTNRVAMFDQGGRLDVPDSRLHAFVVNDILTFTRPFWGGELGALIETDIVRRLEPLHICDDTCTQPCPSAYVEKVFTEIPDPYYMVIRTAGKRAEGDPSASDRVMSLVDEGSKFLSAMRENDSAKTVPDTYQTAELGYTRVL